MKEQKTEAKEILELVPDLGPDRLQKLQKEEEELPGPDLRRKKVPERKSSVMRVLEGPEDFNSATKEAVERSRWLRKQQHQTEHAGQRQDLARKYTDFEL